MITYINQKLNIADTGKLRVEVDKKFNSIYSLVLQ